LHDLVTADVEGLPDRNTRRSLLLSPTGRIRADFHVASVDGSFLLLQAPEQPEAVDTILAPYVLSSDVELDDRTDRSVVVAVVGRSVGSVDGDGDGMVALEPSVLGSGCDYVVRREDGSARLRERLGSAGLVEVAPEDLESWRILRGIARMGADFGPEALPAEAGLEDAIDFTKGCFLGQESVAKVRNLGHPPRLLLPVRSRAPIAPGAPVLADRLPVGEVTSSTHAREGTAAIVRVRWEAASMPLATEAGPLSLQRKQ
jgi:folate-binding protein YgfZ